MRDIKPPKIFIAFDFGMKKIGIAVGQTLTQSATPLTVLSARDGIPDWDRIGELIDTWEANALIVGLPFNMDGSKQAITFAAKKFGNRLQARFQKNVYFIDERLSTIEAKSQVGKSSVAIDCYAAKLILESWFRENLKCVES